MLSSYIFIILTFIPAFVGTVTFKKYKHTFLKYFLFFLWYTCFTESAAFYIGTIPKQSTSFIYNFYALVNVFFYFFLFKFYIKKNIIYIKVFFTLFLLFFLYDFFVIQDSINRIQTYSFLFAFLFNSLGIIMLLFELLKSDLILKMNKLLLFWICTGTLLFYIGIIPIQIMAKFFNYRGLFDYIILGLNIIMYGFFTIGFIISKKEYNK
ncbi:hypothetical protein BX611_0914 [Lutibacter oceani]|uniref:YhhN-like protein n=2 Tax=Lutibacter oceani TaxID=1853311 RepID=A0A3D9RUH4_9FLAO|nr:hypothetical protein BX611_0914 [Lutibacter oceani]